MELLIVVPMLPPRELCGNSRVHWKTKHKNAQEYGNVVYLLACNQRALAGWTPLVRARVSLLFVFPQHRKRDLDNLVTGMKSALDALVRADIIADDNSAILSIGDVSIAVAPKAEPGVIIKITEA